MGYVASTNEAEQQSRDSLNKNLCETVHLVEEKYFLESCPYILRLALQASAAIRSPSNTLCKTPGLVGNVTIYGVFLQVKCKCKYKSKEEENYRASLMQALGRSGLNVVPGKRNLSFMGSLRRVCDALL